MPSALDDSDFHINTSSKQEAPFLMLNVLSAGGVRVGRKLFTEPGLRRSARRGRRRGMPRCGRGRRVVARCGLWPRCGVRSPVASRGWPDHPPFITRYAAPRPRTRPQSQRYPLRSARQQSRPCAAAAPGCSTSTQHRSRCPTTSSTQTNGRPAARDRHPATSGRHGKIRATSARFAPSRSPRRPRATAPARGRSRAIRTTAPRAFGVNPRRHARDPNQGAIGWPG